MHELRMKLKLQGTEVRPEQLPRYPDAEWPCGFVRQSDIDFGKSARTERTSRAVLVMNVVGSLAVVLPGTTQGGLSVFELRAGCCEKLRTLRIQFPRDTQIVPQIHKVPVDSLRLGGVIREKDRKALVKWLASERGWPLS